MAAAAAAVHLGAAHAVAEVLGGLDRVRLRIVEARPGGSAVELALGAKQWLAAADAAERAGALLVVERAAARRLGAVAAQHVVLLRRQQLAPFRIGVADGILLGLHGWLRAAVVSPNIGG